jgi:pimeloyl-ACP methyl ester carboxylesterase
MMKNLFLMAGMMAALFASYQSFSQGNASVPIAKQIMVNDVTLPYITQGQGTPVVFVHGAFSDLRVWEPQREAVAAHYQYIAYTQRYFGTKPWADKGEKYSQVTHAADLAAFIRQLNVGPVYLVGRSYGGTVAVRVALQHPELVRGVFVQEPTIAATAVADPDVRGILKKERGGLAPAREAAKAAKSDEATRLFADWTNGQPGGFDRLPPETRSVHLDNGRTIALHFAAAFAAAPPPKVSCADLGQMKRPLAITAGELTRPFFKILAETAHNCVPGSQLILIPGARHAATTQNPAAFNNALLTFLASH